MRIAQHQRRRKRLTPILTISPVRLVRALYHLFLSLKWRIISRSLEVSVQNATTSATPIQALSPERQEDLLFSHHLARASWLKREVRHAPWWAQGHLELAREALALGDTPLAYASCQAVLKLATRRTMIREAEFLLAKSYVARGMFAEAIHLLTKLSVDSDYSVLEELAAAYIGAGDRAAAVSVLERIPEKERSASARAALSFAAGRHHIP